MRYTSRKCAQSYGPKRAKNPANRGGRTSQVRQDKEKEYKAEEDVVRSASTNNVLVDSTNVDCSKDKQSTAGQNIDDCANEDAIMQEVLLDIRGGDHSSPEGGAYQQSGNVEGPPDETTVPEADHVETSVPVQKESATKDQNEEKLDVPQGVTAGSESTNSGNVNDLVNSFFMTPPPMDQTVSGTGEQHGMENVHGTEPPLFDKTPHCQQVDAMDFAENTTAKKGVEGVPDGHAPQKSASD